MEHKTAKQQHLLPSAKLSISGHGETLESCFSDIAKSMFALMTDVALIHSLKIINFEFKENNEQKALATWLNLLLKKAKEHALVFGDFHLVRQGDVWKATVAGEPQTVSFDRGVAIKTIAFANLSIQKIDHFWEAQCIVNI